MEGSEGVVLIRQENVNFNTGNSAAPQSLIKFFDRGQGDSTGLRCLPM